MRKIVLFLFIIPSLRVFSQREISYFSKNRDTLYLPDNQTGSLLYYSWLSVPRKEWPVIIFVEDVIIAELHRIKEEDECDY